ncbi:OLC1v1023032C1 [Oldenlandia corymbosa var. corymbosa]|uniref:OLC1v1023032C1 n=1 Tax=Oldenlandia corymbosa var. corymbosa TaxID=529605 RepID=A0AAV1BZT1_OLDCO|nr:OLC1v1023032C1 [Oldenlandia corymbosa var. corymbosa]
MESDARPSTFSYCDADEKNLELLLQMFGAVVSLDDIASAYCQSGRDIYSAGNILCSLQRNTSKSSNLLEEDLESTSTSSASSSDNSLELSEATKSKPKKCSASVGTVSGVIGKSYAKPKVSSNGSFKQKPLKLNADDFPVSELWSEKDFQIPISNGDTMHQDIEEFLFQMLGEGFSLDKSVIQDIVGQCGYDVTKSMDKLLYLSASKLGKSDDILEAPVGRLMNKNPNMGLVQPESPIHHSSSGRPLSDTKKSDLEKEVLEALFNYSVRPEEEDKDYFPRRIVRTSSAYGKVVEKPLNETIIEHRSVIRRKRVNVNDEEGEDSYDGLRKAVTEYWRVMKEYYKAAADAFANQDHEKAQKLMEEGHFFMKKAREADEKSAIKLFESNDEEEIYVDLLDFEPKEAVHCLKVQLTSLSGVPGFTHLKVRLGRDEESAKDGSRKRRITRLLTKEGIMWAEEENGWVYVIAIDRIDPKKLSFANNQSVILANHSPLCM